MTRGPFVRLVLCNRAIIDAFVAEYELDAERLGVEVWKVLARAHRRAVSSSTPTEGRSGDVQALGVQGDFWL